MTLKSWELMPGQAVTLRRDGGDALDATFLFRTARLACFERDRMICGRIDAWFWLLKDGTLLDEDKHPWQICGAMACDEHEHGESNWEPLPGERNYKPGRVAPRRRLGGA